MRNFGTTFLSAGALVLSAGIASAATAEYPMYEVDSLIGSAMQSELGAICDITEGCTGGGSGDEPEVAFLASLIDGVDFNDLEDQAEKIESGTYFINDVTDVGREYFYDIAPNTVSWFILKFGVGNTGKPSHYFFENDGAELSKLVWSDSQTNNLLSQCSFSSGSEERGLYSLPSTSIGDPCKLSHITLVDTTPIPLPAAGWLLLGGLGGLAAMRRRNKV